MILTKKHKLLSMTITVSILLFFPGWGFPAEQSVIVGFHKKPGPSEKAFIHNAKGVVKHAYRLIPAMAISLPEEAIKGIEKNPNVAYVEEDGFFKTAGEYTAAWGVGHISSGVAHASCNRGAGVKVAVIDTGIDYTHEDLDGNYAGGYDFVFDDDDPFDDNFQSHGTHVAGIIAAEANGIGVIGVAPEASLYAVKVLDGAGFGLLSWIIAGIEWAVENGMDIVNLSLQGPDYQSLQDACNSTYQAGVLLVAAGGNTDGGSVNYPAAYESVIAVTGTDADDLPAWFSPVGPEVELSAPGVDILSTVTDANGSYSTLSGTSQASPHVAGTAALFLTTGLEDENGNGRINDEVRTILRMTTVDLGENGLDSIYGFGLVNAAAAECIAPPVRQAIGIEDKVFNNMEEADCRFCHATSMPDRHHLLAGTAIPDPTDAPFGTPGDMFACMTCHARDCSTGECNFLVERDCLACHIQGPSELTVHHRSNLAQGNVPQGPDCQACHGSLVDNMNDGHFISSEPPFMSTPKRSGGAGLPYNSRGNGAGACNYCHDDGTCGDGIVVETNMITHHDTGLGSDTAKCGWCHDFSMPFEEQIRVCENCHGRDSIHNIQLDSDGDGIINPGVELPGFGHIGDPDDCWGCHGFGSLTASSPETGTVIPHISGISPSVLTAGADAVVTITGAAFTNLSQGTTLASNVILTAGNGSSTELIPDMVDENSMTLTIHGTFASGNYILRAAKLDKFSNPAAITVKSAVAISSTVCSACTGVITINGSGFGDAPPEGAQGYINVEQDGLTLNIHSWTDTQIKAQGADCNFDSVTINSLFGSATQQQ